MMDTSIQVVAPDGCRLGQSGVKDDAGAAHSNALQAPLAGSLCLSIAGPANVPYGAIPQALQALPQWFCWRYDEAGKKPPYNPRTGQQCDHTNPANWCSFADACAAVALGYSGIGFSMVQENELVIIDLDDKLTDPASDSDLALFTEIYTSFGTYTERSVGGRGIHIICKGKLPESVGDGRKKGRVEIYAAKHYFTFSGNMDLQGLQFIPEVYSPILSINDCQHEMDGLFSVLGLGTAKSCHSVEEVPQVRTCNEVLNAIDRANNRDAIVELFQGCWADNYPSQSEADLSLIQGLMFYGATNEQAKHLWLDSALSPANAKARKSIRLILCSPLIRGVQFGDADQTAQLARQAEAQIKADALSAELANNPAVSKAGTAPRAYAHR